MFMIIVLVLQPTVLLFWFSFAAPTSVVFSHCRQNMFTTLPALNYRQSKRQASEHTVVPKRKTLLSNYLGKVTYKQRVNAELNFVKWADT